MALYSEGPMFRSSYVHKYLLRRSYIQKVLYSEGPSQLNIQIYHFFLGYNRVNCNLLCCVLRYILRCIMRCESRLVPSCTASLHRILCRLFICVLGHVLQSCYTYCFLFFVSRLNSAPLAPHLLRLCLWLLNI